MIADLNFPEDRRGQGQVAMAVFVPLRTPGAKLCKYCFVFLLPAQLLLPLLGGQVSVSGLSWAPTEKYSTQSGPLCESWRTDFTNKE